MMKTENANILLFKTNICTEPAKFQLRKVLEQFTGIERWTIDSEDIDCVLRIVSNSLGITEVIRSVRQLGFECAELD